MMDILKRLGLKRSLVILTLLLACIGLEYYLHRVLSITEAYTHLFYVPLFIAAFWWGFGGGLLVGIALALIHIISYIPSIDEMVLATSSAFVFVGSATGMIGSERKRTEKRLREAYERERRLRGELQTEMNRRVQFTRLLVHELKTPLTPVLASSDLLAAEIREEPFLSLARNINRGASALNERIDELLDLAKGEIGMLRLTPRVVDPFPLLVSAAQDITSLTLSQGQSFILDLPASLPPVRADEKRLRQIVLNLLNNACKFTPKGGKITLRARTGDARLIVEVEDTGQGITEEEQARLFQPYYRLETDRERLSGLGLGLALCKTLVELHRGEIWVRSQKGKGSTFGFSIPLEKEV